MPAANNGAIGFLELMTRDGRFHALDLRTRKSLCGFRGDVFGLRALFAPNERRAGLTCRKCAASVREFSGTPVRSARTNRR